MSGYAVAVASGALAAVAGMWLGDRRNECRRMRQENVALRAALDAAHERTNDERAARHKTADMLIATYTEPVPIT